MAKKQELSLQEEIEVLDKVKKQPPNSSQRELAEIFKIPRSTLTRLLNKEEELRSRWCEVFCHGHKPAKKLKRLRKGKAPEVDTALNLWFGIATSKGQKLSGPILGEGRGFSPKVRTIILLPQKAGFHAGRQGIKLGTSGHMERREVQTLKVLKSGQALFYQGYWKNIGLMRSIMLMKLGCITEPLLMAHFAIVMKN